MIRVLRIISVAILLSCIVGCGDSRIIAEDGVIQVTSPNGGDVWAVGTDHDITWTITRTVGDVDLAYATDGDSWKIIDSGIDSSLGTYTWTVPDDPSTTARVRVQEPDGDPADTSEEFAIVAARCGNDVIEEGETCDPPETCPATCDDGNPCTIDTMTGSSANCNVACSRTSIVDCANDDGCCPAGCNGNIDNDCSPNCGNDVIEEGETCDPPDTCPATCDDGDPCTIDTMTGSASNCNAACSYTEIVDCADGDGCCPAGCNANTDSDCSDCESPDMTAPVASDHVPAPETRGAERETIIEVHLFDACDVDVSSITMTVQGVLMPVNITGSGTDVTVTTDPGDLLAPGDIVTVTVTAADTTGNTLDETWRFSVRDTMMMGSHIMNGIDEAMPDVNISPGSSSYEVGGGPGNEKKVLFSLDPNIPEGALIFDARLNLGVCEPAPTADTSIDCYRLNVGHSVNQSTWNERAPDQPWAAPGANGIPDDRQGTAGASVLFPDGAPLYRYVDGDARSLAEDWAGGAVNHGVICSTAATIPVGVCSPWGNAAAAPRMTVDFGPPLP